MINRKILNWAPGVNRPIKQFSIVSWKAESETGTVAKGRDGVEGLST